MIPEPATAYPDNPPDRDRWILGHRGERQSIDPRLPYAVSLEEERAESGEVVSVTTIFLASRECPWRCLMCDLWKNTLQEATPAGAIPAQMDHALARLYPSHPPGRSPGLARLGRHLKLYNSGSFFDPRSVPREDLPAIAQRAGDFDRVIVESHPALIGAETVRFRDLLEIHAVKQQRGLSRFPRLEVAMGLETAHPQVLEKLNKRMTLEQFAQASEFLRANGIAVRAFILVRPPFLSEAEALTWAERSLDFAFAAGAGVAVLIPTRAGNGALEALARQGKFSPPSLATLEAALDYGLGLRRGRVFADLWDLDKLAGCAACFPARAARLRSINLHQQTLRGVGCSRCGAVAAPPADPLASVRSSDTP
jgi:archaeosine synthase beta-subunit